MLFRSANEHALRGALVGVHAYNRVVLKRHGLVSLPNVLVAKTHRRLFATLCRYAKLHGIPWQRVRKAGKLEPWVGER